MNSMVRSALTAYSQVGIETNVVDSDPHQLISMLFDGAIAAVATAKSNMLRKDIAAKGAAISKAISLIDQGLKVSLDEKAGGELAQNLKALYEYMCRQLLVANLNNEIALLDEVMRLLSDLKGAWDSIGKTSPHPVKTAAAEPPPPQQRSAVSYGKV